MRPLMRSVTHPQGIPIGSSLILRLRCGHIVIQPQHPAMLRRLVYCRMCFLLWTEREAEHQESKKRSRKRETKQLSDSKEITDIMATKKTSSKKSASKASASDRRGRKVFEFVKASKDEMAETTIGGIVYHTIKKMKSGTVADISSTAEKALKDVTGQDPLVQTGVWLNRLKAKGIVRKVKPEGSKAVKAAGTKKVFRLKKSAAKSAAA